MDHIGRIPKLVRDGFNGTIYSSPETQKLAVIMLEDCLKIITQEAERQKIDPLFESKDVTKAISLWKSIPYHTKTELYPGYSVYLKDAGHVLGSTMFEITYSGPATEAPRKLVFTGDLGNSPTPLLRDTEDITDADYLVMESVYGDRNHEDREHRLDKFEDVIQETAKIGGTLIIPIFSLEKSQEMIYELNNLVEEHRVPPMPVYLDSPLAIKITEVYKQMIDDFNATAQEKAKHDDLFKFKNLHFVNTSEESKAIKDVPSPKIIMAGSGMSNGGRVLHHELNYLSDPKTILLLVGYQAVGTLGRHIQDGASVVTIHGVEVTVNAQIRHIDGYSSHKDSDHLVEFVEKTADTLKKAFVVMGETKSSMFLVQRLRDYLGVEAHHPEEGEVAVIK
jgi:metallo-beta-lactamase family protein